MEIRTKMIEKRMLDRLSKSRVDHAVPFCWDKRNRKVLILSPHYDDDIISCGGIMYFHCQHNDQLDVIYFTDGSASLESGFEDAHMLTEIRQRESMKSCDVIGHEINLISLNEKDGALHVSDELIHYLSNRISEEKYDRIYFPSLNDIHNDHVSTTMILKHALTTVDYINELAVYEFWNPLMKPNRFIDISRIENIKLKALSEHKSQLKYLDYIRLVQTLNRYRGFMTGCISSEMFQLVTKKELLNSAQ